VCGTLSSHHGGSGLNLRRRHPQQPRLLRRLHCRVQCTLLLPQLPPRACLRRQATRCVGSSAGFSLNNDRRFASFRELRESGGGGGQAVVLGERGAQLDARAALQM
jgi:hypothetical protein